MACRRFQRVLSALAAGAAALGGFTSLQAETPAVPGPAPIPSSPGTTPYALRRQGPPPAALGSPEMETMRRTLDSLTPQQREHFKENLLRWMNMSPEEKKALRDLGELRRKKMADETEHALKETGLTLSPEQREQFVRRYAEERRLLEENLRREMEEKRKPMVRELIRRLREEFANGTVPSPPVSSN